MREGFDVKKECIDDELEKGKYMSDLQMFTNYGDKVKIDQCKEYAKAEMYSRWEESDDKIENCDHYSDKWYDINRRIIPKIGVLINCERVKSRGRDLPDKYTPEKDAIKKNPKPQAMQESTSSSSS
jgi:hypothetical protein